MTVAAAFLYRKGKRIGELDINEPSPCEGKGEFAWIGVVEPDEAELRTLAKNFALHPLAVEDAFNAHQLPKVDVYGNQLFVAAKTAHLDGEHIDYGETAIFVGQNHIITVRHGSARSHSELRTLLEAAPTLLAHGTDYVLHAILDFIVDGYLPIVQAIEDQVLQTEQRAISMAIGQVEAQRLFGQRRELIKFQRTIGPMRELSSKLATLDLPCIDPEARPYFRDVYDHAKRVDSMIDALRDVLTSVFEISSLLEAQRQNAIVRKLASWAAILAVPTAIAGIYGMNFEHMPELGTRYGYFIVLGVIGAICTWLFVRFRRTGWL